MLYTDIILRSGKILGMKKGNQLIEKVVNCLKNEKLTILEVKCILEEAAKEIEDNVVFK